MLSSVDFTASDVFGGDFYEGTLGRPASPLVVCAQYFGRQGQSTLPTRRHTVCFAHVSIGSQATREQEIADVKRANTQGQLERDRR